MLKKVEIKNFQAHKSLTVRLQPGVNVLVAPTNFGKSAILRAIGWVAFNKPAGDSFITHGEKNASVTLTTDENVVRRVKNSKRNGYDLNGEKSDAIGRDVPEVVQEALGITNLNFQDQHSAPFLLSNTPGEVGKYLNSLVDLTVIDSTLTGLNSKAKDTNKRINILKETEKEQTAQLLKYEGFTEAKDELDTLVQLDQTHRYSLKRSLELEGILKQYRSKEMETENLLTLTHALSYLNTLREVKDNHTKKANKITTLEKLIQRCEDSHAASQGGEEIEQALEALLALDLSKHKCDSLAASNKALYAAISAAQSAFDDAQGVSDIAEAIDGLERLKSNYSRITARTEKIAGLSGNLDKIQEQREKVAEFLSTIGIMEAEHEELFGSECPLCGRSMS